MSSSLSMSSMPPESPRSLAEHPYFPCLIVDMETRSTVDLKTHGVSRYASHESTEILILCYAIMNGPKDLVDVKTVLFAGGVTADKNPLSTGNLIEFMDWEGRVVAHNWNFEFSLLNRYSRAPNTYEDPNNYVDTMELAYRWGLPGKLEKASESLGKAFKNPKGEKLIQKYSIPAKAKTRACAGYEGRFEDLYAPENEQDLKDFIEYCADDVRASAELLRALPPLDERETRITMIDRKMNLDGVRFDLDAVAALKRIYDAALVRLEQEASDTIGETDSGKMIVSSPLAFRSYLEQHGLTLPDTRADTLLKAKIPEHLTHTIALAQAVNAKSPKKLQAILDRIDADGRLRFFLQYYGAHTGRWGGRGVQLQNFPRECVEAESYVDEVRGFMSAVQKDECDDLSVVELIPTFLRGLIIPDDGNFFGYADYSAIEARVIFWLAGAKRALAAYAEGRDLYVELANKLPLAHMDPKKARGVGKVGILSLGFGMGERALDIRLEPVVGGVIPGLSRTTVKTYREVEYPEVPAFWSALEKAWYTCVETGKPQKVGRLNFYRTSRTLRIVLPSGREVSYFNPRKMTYMNPKYGRIDLYGGKIAENVTQATARDIMTEAMLRLDEIGLPLRMTEHDAVIYELRNDAEYAIFEREMSRIPDWADGLPLKADIKRMPRGGK